jgi:hypothetical protein
VLTWREEEKKHKEETAAEITKQNKTSNLCWQVLFSEQRRFFVSISELNLISFSAR